MIRQVMVWSSVVLVVVGGLSALGLLVALPMVRIAPRRPTPESLGDWSMSLGQALGLAYGATIGIGNAIVLRRARSDWAGVPSPESAMSAAVGIGEVLAAVVWGWSVVFALEHHFNWRHHPGDPGLLGAQAVMAAALLLKGAWTIRQEWRSARRRSPPPKRETG